MEWKKRWPRPELDLKIIERIKASCLQYEPLQEHYDYYRKFIIYTSSRIIRIQHRNRVPKEVSN